MRSIIRTSVSLPIFLALTALGTTSPQCPAQQLTIVKSVEKQPLISATKRLVEAMESAGSPLSATIKEALKDAYRKKSDDEVSAAIQAVLDPMCIAGVDINAESRVKVTAGDCPKQLMEAGWRTFLVKVHNQAEITPVLKCESPNAAPVYQQGEWPRERPKTKQKLVEAEDLPDRFLTFSMLDRPPIQKRLSGLKLEYRILLLYSRDQGKREGALSFHVGAGTQDIGFRNAIPVLFDCMAAVKVNLNVQDFDGQPATCALVIKDQQGRVYPHQSRRLSPDFFFHQQIYRADGESVALPPGKYSVSVSRGPEYQPIDLDVVVPDAAEHELTIKLERWIHLAKRNWFSGDHHIHAAGCSHYDSPTEGVGPDAMMRHILGENLNVGNVLSWGPCWYSQKRFFEGDVSKLSTPQCILRYDVEVSGFPSSHAGHLCLLKLSEDDYPDSENLEDWPSWTLPVLKWGQGQGGVVGYSHSGWGLALPDHMPDGSRAFVDTPWGGAPEGWRGKPAHKLPDYAVPKFDGIGANEYIVAAAHEVCDFISAVDTPFFWELNIWYHTLNCGFTVPISGETDFPCIYDDRVGLGRIYVKLDEGEKLTYDRWVSGLKDGRSYCTDGLSHIVDFSIDGLGVGERRPGIDQPSRLDIEAPGKVKVRFDAAALLSEEPNERTEKIRNLRLDDKPYWHVERARIGESRTVPIEILVNGEVAKTQELTADGDFESMEIEVDIEKSSWVAVRILPSAHTNPIFVHVNDEPIRANRKSAQWCIDAVAACWKSKKKQIHESEREAAKKAYDQATKVYEQILAESD